MNLLRQRYDGIDGGQKDFSNSGGLRAMYIVRCASLSETGVQRCLITSTPESFSTRYHPAVAGSPGTYSDSC